MAKSGITFKAKPNAFRNAVASTPFTFNCPKCGNKVMANLNQVNIPVTCSFCGVQITLKNNNIDNQLNDIQKSFEKAFK